MPLVITRNDIVNMHTDAIVNTANPHPVIGGGTDKAIHDAAGLDLLKAREKIGDITPGSAAVTPAFKLAAKYVIHTVGPVWKDGKNGEQKTLASCYMNALNLAEKKKCKSISFPLISTGTYGFPKDLALQTATDTIQAFLQTHDMEVYLVVFDQDSFRISQNRFSTIKSFIDEQYCNEKNEVEYTDDLVEEELRRDRGRAAAVRKHIRSEIVQSVYENEIGSICGEKNIQDLLNSTGETFSEKLFSLIREKKVEETVVYKKANIDRKLFSKIRSRDDYKPARSTAIALCIALELSLDETDDLLERAGYALSHSNKADIIIEYFITQKEYNIFEINEALFAFGQPLLGEK